MILEVVQVELVGDEWWEKALPILAIIVSVGTLLWTMQTRYSDKARLKVMATSFTLLGNSLYGPDPDRQEWHVALDVTNVGLVGSTVVHGVKFKLPNRTYLQSAQSYGTQVMLPKTLAPGESFTYAFNVHELAAELVRHGFRADQIVPMATSGHRPYKGKWVKAGLTILENAVRAKSPKDPAA
ncbi:hypothetical protein [Arthrobacter sp. StoSoilB22]|uniref:hypothetical protein n=1 Tax=Arthrobacter sp. StoSoilB22 TaxID=2830996 RepID=UPI001CC42143|nr:hypothetical protein [Arthrobacter sp. StoSoilB22]